MSVVSGMKVTIKDLDLVADNILKEFPAYRIFALKGEMGAGKTTFTKVLCKALGVDKDVSSPTFALVNEYDSNSYGEIFHFDFYRLKNVKEAMDIGLEDYLYSGNYCILEWPDIILDYIPKPFVEVWIKYTDDNSYRIIEAKLIE